MVFTWAGSWDRTPRQRAILNSRNFFLKSPAKTTKKLLGPHFYNPRRVARTHIRTTTTKIKNLEKYFTPPTTRLATALTTSLATKKLNLKIFSSISKLYFKFPFFPISLYNNKIYKNK
jgi:hypothetical protein